MRMKWEYTTDKTVATLVNPNSKVLSATIVYKENSIVRNEKYYLHITKANGKEINEHFVSMQTAQKFARLLYN